MNNITWKQLASDWNKAIIKILLIIPSAILSADRPKRTNNEIITRLIPTLIFVLSVASITNLSTRAYSHHANPSSWLAWGLRHLCRWRSMPLSRLMVGGTN